MAKYCPILNEKVTYLYCQECDDKICEKEKEENKFNNEKKAEEE